MPLPTRGYTAVLNCSVMGYTVVLDSFTPAQHPPRFGLGWSSFSSQ